MAIKATGKTHFGSAHNETQQEIQPEQSQQHYSNEIHAGTKAMDEIRQCFN